MAIRGLTTPLRESVIGRPVLIKAFSIRSTVAFGLRCFKIAKAPLT